MVADSGPLIALTQIGHLHVVELVYTQVLIPPSVAVEVSPSIPRRPAWMSVLPVSKAEPDFSVCSAIDPGERDAIRLALELEVGALLVDDYAARTCAERLGLTVTGTLGLLARAKHLGIVPEVLPLYRGLAQSRFFMSDAIVRALLVSVGEDPDAFFRS